MLGDKRGYVRRIVVEALDKIGDSKAVYAIIESLGDEDKNVRCSAISALGNIRDPKTVDVLIEALGDESDTVQYQAVKILGEIGDPKAVDALMKLVNSPITKRFDGFLHTTIQWEAITAIGKIENPKSIEALKIVSTNANVKGSLRAEAKRLTRKLKFKQLAHAKETAQKVEKDLEVLQEKQQSSKLTQTDVEQTKELYDKAKEAHEMVKDSGDTSTISQINKLLETVSKFHSQIVVHGDYMEGGKTDMEGAVIQRSTIGAEKKEEGFKICPYCGEELNFPKPPKFCPYCKEQLR